MSIFKENIRKCSRRLKINRVVSKQCASLHSENTLQFALLSGNFLLLRTQPCNFRNHDALFISYFLKLHEYRDFEIQLLTMAFSIFQTALRANSGDTRPRRRNEKQNSRFRLDIKYEKKNSKTKQRSYFENAVNPTDSTDTSASDSTKCRDARLAAKFAAVDESFCISESLTGGCNSWLFLAAFARDYHAMGERKVKVTCNVSVGDTVGGEGRGGGGRIRETV